jgi:hypothetical protein
LIPFILFLRGYRNSILHEFWKDLTGRGKVVNTNSEDLAIFIYSNGYYNSRFHADDNQLVDVSLTSAHRLSAAVLLYQSSCYFKRVLSKAATAAPPTASAQPNDFSLIEGGYRMQTVDEVYRQQARHFLALSDRGNLYPPGSGTALSCAQEERDIYSLAEKGYNRRILSSCRRTLELFSLSEDPQATRIKLLKQKHRYEKNKKLFNALMSREMMVPKVVTYICQGLGVEPTISNVKLFLAGKFCNATSANGKHPATDVSPAALTENTRPVDILSSGSALHAGNTSRGIQLEVANRRLSMNEVPLCKPGKRNSAGKIDFRGGESVHPFICVDNAGTKFYDDCISVSPNGEIMVHIVDIAAYLVRKGFPVADVARERGFSVFGNSAAGIGSSLHMLPITLLNVLKLSTEQPNDVLTTSFKSDPSTGEIVDVRVFASVIGPVHPITIREADSYLHIAGRTGSDGYDAEGKSKYILRDLGYISKFAISNSDISKWAGYSADAAVNLPYDGAQEKSADRPGSDERAISPATSMLNILLSLYSNYAYRLCVEKHIPVPVVWNNRLPTRNSMIHRFGTKPLRDWISLLQQKQLRSALKLDFPLKRSECADAVVHYNRLNKQWSKFSHNNRFTDV